MSSSSCPISNAISRFSSCRNKDNKASEDSGYKSFAIWDAGQMSKPLIDALLALDPVAHPDITVTVLTPSRLGRLAQNDTGSDRSVDTVLDTNWVHAALGARVIPFDMTSPLAAYALVGIDVLITTIGGSGASTGSFITANTTSVQPELIAAATKAGVKLLILGDGAEISATGRRNIAYSTVRALTNFPPEMLEGDEFFVNYPYIQVQGQVQGRESAISVSSGTRTASLLSFATEIEID